MNNKKIIFTAAQFAKLYGINKKTLHYYDQIGLFSPRYRGENGYRYYDYQQGFELGFILMLKDLDMSLEEIKVYIKEPSSEAFLSLVDNKCDEIDKKIHSLNQTKLILEHKAKLIKKSMDITDNEIELVNLPKTYMIVTRKEFKDYTPEMIFEHLGNTWKYERFRTGCGSFISTEKVKSRNFESYDGMYSVVSEKAQDSEHFFVRPEGLYLRGYYSGSWDGIPEFYEKMMVKAETENLRLIGDAYEMGINEEILPTMEEYVCQITVEVAPKNLKRKLKNKGLK